jgi:hypothetical protein
MKVGIFAFGLSIIITIFAIALFILSLLSTANRFPNYILSIALLIISHLLVKYARTKIFNNLD